MDLNKSSPDQDEFSDDEKFKYLGINLSEIPFIDDSRYSSYVDLTWNPYQPLTNQ